MFRDYRNCMFRSEWLNDAKFKSLVANDGTDWCLKVRKAKKASRKRKCTFSAQTRSQIESMSLTVTATATLTVTLTVALTMTLSELRFIFVTL